MALMDGNFSPGSSSGYPRMARLRPDLAAQHPSIGPEWFPVLKRNAASLRPDPLPGHVWVCVDGRPRLLPVSLFEFSDATPSPSVGL